MKASVKTWLRNIENGNIRSKTERVLKEIKDCPISTLDLRNKLLISHQTLTSALTNLNDAGLIKVVGEYKRNSSVYSIYAFISHPIERNNTILLRENEKYVKWLKKANSFEHKMSIQTYRHIIEDLMHAEQNLFRINSCPTKK